MVDERKGLVKINSFLFFKGTKKARPYTLDYKCIRVWLSNVVAGTGFEPMTFGL